MTYQIKDQDVTPPKPDMVEQRSAATALENLFQLRPVHGGSPLDTALRGLTAKLPHGAPTGTPVRPQAATSASGHVVEG